MVITSESKEHVSAFKTFTTEPKCNSQVVKPSVGPVDAKCS